MEARAVVVGQGAAGAESETKVEPLSGAIWSADLETEGLRAAPAELAEGVLREPGTEAPARGPLKVTRNPGASRANSSIASSRSGPVCCGWWR